MIELFYMGGPLFMGILTIIFVAMIVVSVLSGLPLITGKLQDDVEASRKIGYIKQIGLFALIVGILGQLIGLFMAFNAIEAAGDISPRLIAGGVKISMITTLYGMLIYVISFLIWFGLSLKIK